MRITNKQLGIGILIAIILLIRFPQLALILLFGIPVLAGVLVLGRKKETPNQVNGLVATEGKDIALPKDINDYVLPNSTERLPVKAKKIYDLLPMDKHVRYNGFYPELFVDDVNKEFYIANGKTIHRYDYAKINDYEYCENGTSIVSGKAGSAVVGGVLFGPLGALAGASGKRKSKEKIKSSKINIYMNDLSNSLIELTMPMVGTTKGTAMYEGGVKYADEIISTLIYMKTNK